MEAIPFEQSKWLILSSSAFAFPAFYSYYHKNLLDSVLILGGVAVSIHYWKDAKPDYKRDLDIYYQRCLFVYFTYNGVKYIQVYTKNLIFYNSLLVAVLLYYLSNRTYNVNEKSNQWVNYHLLFHFVLFYTTFMVVWHKTNARIMDIQQNDE